MRSDFQQHQGHLEANDGITRTQKQSPSGKAIAEALKASGVEEAKRRVTKTTATLKAPLDGLPAISNAPGDFKCPPSNAVVELNDRARCDLPLQESAVTGAVFRRASRTYA